MANRWFDEVLEFWFEELTPEDWYTGSEKIDRTIRDRFAKLHEKLKSDLPEEVFSDPRCALAGVIALDQFPRNIYRRQPEAFAADAQALRIATDAVDKGFDEQLSGVERQFLYMPFMHSEVAADQERAVMLFENLGNQEGLKYAIEHRDIIARFGRFPHRNRALNRETTDDEAEFLKGHDGYGQ